MKDGLILYVPGVLLILILLVKAPTLRRGWAQPPMRAVCALLVVGCLVLVLAAPPTIAAVNRLTGVANFSAPLVFGLITMFSGACVVLVLQWGGGPPDAVRRATRLTVAGFGAVTVLIVVLFMIGDAPVERLRDLDTYYADTPWIREMVVCYLLAHTVGSTALTVLTGRWLRRADPSLRPLRTGLALIMLGGVLDLGYLLMKWIALSARWSGRDWDALSTDAAPPLASGAALLVATGFIVPLVGGSQTWRDFSQYRRLHPLWKALRGFAASSVRTVPLAWWSPVGIRLIHRESVIDDGILALALWFDPSVRSAAYEAACGQGMSQARAAVVADAAMIAAACGLRTASGEAAGPPEHPEPPRLSGQPLTALALEFRTSPIVAAARRDAVRA
ncbi:MULTISPECIES: MAB_1171c family putative transporter [unclassified Streptomyces]|uniref:MAB_1171c family putative transporter n=1 Tax=unclassified Streptomyces TaxID=2593676 RepID=UPI00380FC68C